MASSLGYVPRVVHKYDGTNWSVWQKDMTEVLSYVGVVDLIVKKSPRPEPASEDNADELLLWYNKDRLAVRAIRLNISGSVLPFIFFPSKSTLWNCGTG